MLGKVLEKALGKALLVLPVGRLVGMALLVLLGRLVGMLVLGMLVVLVPSGMLVGMALLVLPAWLAQKPPGGM